MSSPVHIHPRSPDDATLSSYPSDPPANFQRGQQAAHVQSIVSQVSVAPADAKHIEKSSYSVKELAIQGCYLALEFRITKNTEPPGQSFN
jgi:hypothetical protein